MPRETVQSEPIKGGPDQTPAREITRRFCASVSAFDASTSKTATTRVSDFCAC